MGARRLLSLQEQVTGAAERALTDLRHRIDTIDSAAARMREAMSAEMAAAALIGGAQSLGDAVRYHRAGERTLAMLCAQRDRLDEAAALARAQLEECFQRKETLRRLAQREEARAAAHRRRKEEATRLEQIALSAPLPAG